MNTDRDPNLLALFAQAEVELNDAEFVLDVMRTVDGQRHRTLFIWTTCVAAILVCLALFAAPVVTVVNMATQLLPTSLVSIETDWMQQLLAPINSVAFAIALGILAVGKFFRRIRS